MKPPYSDSGKLHMAKKVYKLSYGQKNANRQNKRYPAKQLDLIEVRSQTAVSICPTLPHLHTLILTKRSIITKMKMINFEKNAVTRDMI